MSSGAELKFKETQLQDAMARKGINNDTLRCCQCPLELLQPSTGNICSHREVLLSPEGLCTRDGRRSHTNRIHTKTLLDHSCHRYPDACDP